VTREHLAQLRVQAEKHRNRHSGRIVLELLDEIVRLRALWDRNETRRNAVSDESLWPFGEYKGERMVDVPEDYLMWWVKSNPRDGLRIDADFAPAPANFAARRKLRIYDYIQQRITDETNETASELSDEGLLDLVRNNGFPNATIIEEEG